MRRSPCTAAALLALALVCPAPGCGDDTSATASMSASKSASATSSTGETSSAGEASSSASSSGTEGGSDSDGAGTSTTTSSGGATTSQRDPCDPNPCAHPPAPSCEGDVLREPEALGSCVSDDGLPTCEYAVTETDCAGLDPLSVCAQGACVPIAAPAEGEVIFVELLADPAVLSDFDAEWIEVKNVSDRAVDLEGCRLRDEGVNDDDHTIASGGPLLVMPGALALLAKSDDAAENGGLTEVAYSFGGGFSLTNTGDEVILECDDVVVDALVYAPKLWPFDVGVAMALDPGREDGAQNDDPTAWCAASEEFFADNYGTPGVANPPCR
ncbi:MAG: lamin tail domain-containing protein [Nannocystaceae bacterium]